MVPPLWMQLGRSGTVPHAFYGNVSRPHLRIYNGISGNRGDELIKIDGVTNLDSEMKVFGFASGRATVEYEFYEVV